MPTESRTLTLSFDERTATLAAEALRGEADRRRRAGLTVSAELSEAKIGGADIRSGALQVVATLAEADRLASAAEALDAAWEVGKPAGPAKRTRRGPTPPPTETSAGDDDDETDALDDDTLEKLAAAAGVGPDGATVVEHTDDPDIAAAREALGLVGDPAAVAPAAPKVPPA